MSTRSRLHQLTLALTLITLTSTAQAADNRPEPQGGRNGEPPAPPQEAIDACSGLSEGDACSFAGRRNDTLNGECALPPQGESLACRPEHRGGPPPRGGTPPERDS